MNCRAFWLDARSSRDVNCAVSWISNFSSAAERTAVIERRFLQWRFNCFNCYRVVFRNNSNQIGCNRSTLRIARANACACWNHFVEYAVIFEKFCANNVKLVIPLQQFVEIQPSANCVCENHSALLERFCHALKK